MLRLAGKHADIVSVLGTSVASGTVEDSPLERMPDEVDRKLGWIREGAGERYSQIELNLIPTVVLSDDRRIAADRIIDERRWAGVTPDDVLGMPSLLIGTHDEIAETLIERRARYGFSYYVVSDEQIDDVAPLVRELSGR
jgi:alkanesulfonate monooxygenase SsuD/methylene tetrahydromethanopterin reductase-like flavin-dependent oxidoreductase (luciferase family)